ncbi:MAG TPA: undecaprenyl-diphosphatase UppP [Candidatus Moranbacteria bacterium]|nr:undecaprenyl-diphosphatase UppP [Candidatus Moranbacteria bacterium]
MTVFQAIILGLVQGLGEFLPISSSGHLIIVPWLFNFPDPGLAFDVALHLGTLLAVFAYFRKDWVRIIKLAISRKKRDRFDHTAFFQEKYNKNLLWLLIIATIPGVIAGYFLENLAETFFRNPLLIAFTFATLGFLLYLSDKKAQKNKDLKTISAKDASIIGLFQALAIIPGVSRAGATITSGLFLGFDRVSAAKFSFLLSTPIIFGATVLKFGDFIKAAGCIEVLGVLTAMVSGYFAIWGLIKLVERASYKIFFWYRLLFALIIVVFWFFRL